VKQAIEAPKDFGLPLGRRIELAMLAQGSPAEQLTAQMIAEGHVEGYSDADRQFIAQYVGDQRKWTRVELGGLTKPRLRLKFDLSVARDTIETIRRLIQTGKMEIEVLDQV